MPLKHRIPTSGYLFRERRRKPNIRKDKIEEFGLQVEQIKEIKEGADLRLPGGELVAHEELIIPAPKPRSFAYCCDTAYDESIVAYIQGVDLLYHDATFADADEERAAITMHSTARQAAEIARKAGVGKLILGHYSSRYRDLSILLEQAREVFPSTELGIEGRAYALPLSNRAVRREHS